MPAATPWYTGVQVPLAFTLTDSTGTAQDASGGTGTVVATVTLPDGTTSAPTVTHGGSAGSGQYSAVYTTTQAGHHIVSWAVPGTVPGSYTDTFEVQAATDKTIVSLAEAKEILKLQATAQFDLVIQGYNAAITDWVEFTIGPCVRQTVIEVLPADGTVIALSKPPVIALVNWVTPPPGAGTGTSVPSPPSPMYPMRTYGITYPGTDLSTDLARGLVRHQSLLPFIFGDYAWQYTAGRPVIPNGIYEACKIVLKHLYAVERGGQAGGTQASYGESEAASTVTGFGFAVPNRAIELLTPFRGPYQAAMA